MYISLPERCSSARWRTSPTTPTTVRSGAHGHDHLADRILAGPQRRAIDSLITMTWSLVARVRVANVAPGLQRNAHRRGIPVADDADEGETERPRS
jgi:hypothetical protein